MNASKTTTSWPLGIERESQGIITSGILILVFLSELVVVPSGSSTSGCYPFEPSRKAFMILLVTRGYSCFARWYQLTCAACASHSSQLVLMGEAKSPSTIHKAWNRIIIKKNFFML